MIAPALLPPVSFANSWTLLLLVLIPIIAAGAWYLGDPATPARRRLILLRTLTWLAVILALSEPLLAREANATTTIFVVDRSTSVTTNGDMSGANWLSSALKSANSGDDAAIISFGGSAALTVPVRGAGSIPGDWTDSVDASTIDPDYSNMESALALARTLPVGGNRRIVLISDGAQNIGSVQTQAAQAASDGLPVDVLIVPGAATDDLRVDSLTLPASIWKGEQPNVLVGVSTVAPGPATLNLVVDGAIVDTQAVTLASGLSTWSFTMPVLEAGFHDVHVTVTADSSMDAVASNNDAPAALIVRDAPNVLLVADADSDPSNLATALSKGGATLTRVTPERMPSQLSLLGAYDAFVLDNVPASDFQVEQLTGLQQATKTLGKGVIVVGGTSSYGPGQYAGTRLEDMLPITVKVTNGRERQHVALLLIVDHSGSMAYDPLQETSKIEMAKQAMHLASTALVDGDTIGVLEFSDSQDWVFPLTQINGQQTRDDLSTAISKIKASGGTEMYPALQVGIDAIRNVDADVRHVVLLSDGKSKSGTEDAYLKLVTEAGQDRTTVSTIAVGDDADTDLLQKIAQAGGGRYHFTNKAEDIPAITLEEAQSAGAESVIRGSFQAIQTNPSPILTGLSPDQLPALSGYDFAEIKPDAQEILVSHRNDPVLAKWQYGLGRVVAWTSDDGADLASGWQSWDNYSAFWAGMLRWTLPDPANNPVSLSVSRDGPDELLALTTSSDPSSTDYVDLTGMTVQIADLQGKVDSGIKPVQTGSGQYQIRIDSTTPGAYQLQLVDSSGKASGNPIGFVLPGSPELQPSANGTEVMTAIASTTGGAVLTLDNPKAAFDGAPVSGSVIRIYRPIWSWFAIIALVALLLDLMTRLHGWDRIRSLLPRRSS